METQHTHTHTSINTHCVMFTHPNEPKQCDHPPKIQTGVRDLIDIDLIVAPCVECSRSDQHKDLMNSDQDQICRTENLLVTSCQISDFRAFGLVISVLMLI